MIKKEKGRCQQFIGYMRDVRGLGRDRRGPGRSLWERVQALNPRMVSIQVAPLESSTSTSDYTITLPSILAPGGLLGLLAWKEVEAR
jgi:hypothetical protein